MRRSGAPCALSRERGRRHRAVKSQVIHPDTDQLRDPEPAGQRDVQHGAIADSHPGRGIGILRVGPKCNNTDGAEMLEEPLARIVLDVVDERAPAVRHEVPVPRWSQPAAW